MHRWTFGVCLKRLIDVKLLPITPLDQFWLSTLLPYGKGTYYIDVSECAHSCIVEKNQTMSSNYAILLMFLYENLN